MLSRLRKLSPTRSRQGEKGQAMIDYALILFLCSTVSVGVLTLLGTSVFDLFTDVEDAILAVF